MNLEGDSFIITDVDKILQILSQTRLCVLRDNKIFVV